MSHELSFARFLIKEADKIIQNTYMNRYPEGSNAANSEETFEERADRISSRAKRESGRKDAVRARFSKS